MTKEIQYSKQARQDLKKLDRKLKIRITGKINLLVSDPAALTNNIRKLQGVADSYRLRIGSYRVIYTDDFEIIEITKIAVRGKIYN